MSAPPGFDAKGPPAYAPQGAPGGGPPGFAAAGPPGYAPSGVQIEIEAILLVISGLCFLDRCS